MNQRKWISAAIVCMLAVAVVSAQQWDRFNGALRLSAASASGTPLVIIDQRGAGKALSLRVSGTEKASFDSNGGFSVGTSASGADTIFVAAAGAYKWNTRGGLTASSDGVLLATNAGGTDFGRLQLGGTTTAFPAIIRSGQTVAIGAADGAGNAYIQSFAATITQSGATGVTSNHGGALQRQVFKATVAKEAFVSAAVTSDVTVATLPAKTVVLGVYADLTQVFACTATCTSSTLSMTLGTAAGGTELLLSFDADAAITLIGDTDAEMGSWLARATFVQGGRVSSFSATTPVSLRLTSGTGNIGNGSATNLSQGSITFYLVTERLP
jgi:hypothetical protein